MPDWKNWSGGVAATPQRVVRPREVAELQAAVQLAATRGWELRVAGSGHSFTPLCATDGLLLVLDDMPTGIFTEPGTLRARVPGGTKLHQLGPPLWAAGLAMENLGDIDRQAIAGAVATGTHGTGRTLSNLSSQVVGLRLVAANGEIVEWAEGGDAEELRAARVSLGLLGVVVELTLRVVPAYHLHERVWSEPLAACLDALEARIEENRHFEFFYYPHRDECSVKLLNPTEDAALSLGEREGERVGPSYAILPSAREHRFEEIEFSLPADSGVECLLGIVELMRQRFTEVRWPIEYRTVAADDAFLSPASGRPTVTISVHQGAGLPQEDFFREVEAIFRGFGGRPHWGKHHSHTGRELEALYPDWQRFAAVRRRLDPEGLFVNPYLGALFEES